MDLKIVFLIKTSHQIRLENKTNRKALFENELVRDDVQAAFSSQQGYGNIEMLQTTLSISALTVKYYFLKFHINGTATTKHQFYIHFSHKSS